MKQITKDEAGYIESYKRQEDPTTRENCHKGHGCAMYQGKHTCELVMGYIHPLAWCTRWVKEEGK